MARKKDEVKDEIKSKIAQIGDYVELKEEAKKDGDPVKEETPNGISSEEEAPKGEEVPELTAAQVKERILKLVSEVGARGLPEGEKERFMEDFRFWNGALFEILDIGNNLKTIVGRTSIKLTPEQAFLVYLLGTGASVVLLRPDLQDRLLKKKGGEPWSIEKKQNTTEVSAQEAEEMINSKIPTQAP